MKKLLGMLLLLSLNFLSSVAEAEKPLDKIMFQLAAKDWVSTQTALLTVNVNATLNNADLVKARADIVTSLGKIAPGQWQLTEFNRSQDNSGLEKLFVIAQARLPQTSLTDIYVNAKKISKPGISYEINAVEFKPSFEEKEQIRIMLRERLYQQVKDELARLNKLYSNQNYSLNRLVFIDGEGTQAKAYQGREINALMASPQATPVLTISNELIMTAVAIAASARTEDKTVVNN